MSAELIKEDRKWLLNVQREEEHSLSELDKEYIIFTFDHQTNQDEQSINKELAQIRALKRSLILSLAAFVIKSPYLFFFTAEDSFRRKCSKMKAAYKFIFNKITLKQFKKELNNIKFV